MANGKEQTPWALRLFFALRLLSELYQDAVMTRAGVLA
jgi:hypothetical protein